MNKKTIEEMNLEGKKVLVRCDFNVPVKDGVITSDKRITGALPTIKYLVGKNCKVILCSHMGKPHNIFDAELKLNKKEIAKIAELPEAEQEAATAAALEKAPVLQETRHQLIHGVVVTAPVQRVGIANLDALEAVVA